MTATEEDPPMTGPESAPAEADPGQQTPISRARRWTSRHALVIYLVLVCSTGAGLAVTAGLYSGGLPRADWLLLLAGVLFLLADRPLLDLRFGHHQESFTWAEVAVVISLATLPLSTVTALSALCVLVSHSARPVPMVKALFNAASFAIGIGLAGLVLRLVAGTPGEIGVRDAVGLAAAAGVFHIWNGAAVSVVIALSEQIPVRAVYARGLLLRTFVCVVNILVGIGALVMVQWSRPSLVVLPPVLLLTYVAYRGYLHALQERDIWQQLESASRELNQLEEHAVAEAAITWVASLLHADRVELVIESGEEHEPRVAFYAGGLDGMLPTVTGASRHLVEHELPSADAAAAMVYATPLVGPQGPIGLLRVSFKGPVELSKREGQVLHTFAHTVSSTLQNARLYSEMRLHAEGKAYEASHDSLTGLGNRALLHDRAAVALAKSAEDGSQCALLIVDLDHFKQINDTLGHVAGDILLRQVGRRIAASMPDAQVVCRLGGDEFAVLHAGLEGMAAADALAARLLQVLAEPVTFDGLRLSVEGSVGIACYPQDAGSFDELLKRADVALYQAKDSRGSFAHYRAERDESSVHRMALAAELRTAISADELVVHFQPQYDLHTGELVGAEALVRWQHPYRGLLLPGEFVSVVEHSGLIRDFTLSVLDKAVAECARWSAGGRSLCVAVNLSARNLLDRELPRDVAKVLRRHGLPPAQLILEITETTMMSELDVVEVVLGELRSLGVQLSVDDFGTGYSSLTFLQRVQVNEIKIDRTFVAGLTTSDHDRALVRATVQLAHSLGARTVGEGVEDAALLEVLKALGCDIAQGYHLGRPVPAEGLRAMIGLPDRREVPVPRAEVGVVRLHPAPSRR